MPRREWLVRGHTDHGRTRVSLTLRSLCSTPFLKHTMERENKQKPWLWNQPDLTSKPASDPVTLDKRLNRRLPHGNDNREPRQCEHDSIGCVPGMPRECYFLPSLSRDRGFVSLLLEKVKSPPQLLKKGSMLGLD